jgi:hypothetical protein
MKAMEVENLKVLPKKTAPMNSCHSSQKNVEL